MQVYRETERFPKIETYGLSAQLRRASVSVVSNIAEGQGRLTRGEFAHFLGLARGSLLEVDAQIAIAIDLGYLTAETFEKLDRQIYQILGLLNRLMSQCDRLSRDQREVNAKGFLALPSKLCPDFETLKL